jgi:integrase
VTPPEGLTYEVRIWKIHKYKGKRGTTYTVKWGAGGKKQQRTFSTLKLAESFRSDLVIAAREGVLFDVRTGLPVTMRRRQHSRTWFEHAKEFVAEKWSHVSPRHRKGIAETMTNVTIALVSTTDRGPATPVLRKALYRWAFNAPAQRGDVPDEYFTALKWIEDVSVPLTSLREASVLRQALSALSTTLDGRAAAPSTVARKRAVFHNALEYAVELEHFESNPLKKVKWRPDRSTEAVDRRVVVNPAQARALLSAVRETSPPVEGFFACLYYAGLRPAEARNLRLSDCKLPDSGWGRLLLTGSHQDAGSSWTDSGRAGEERQLKHRSTKDTRIVPAHPELVETLQRHVDEFGTGADDRLFVTRTGKRGVPLPPPYSNPISMGTAYRVWHKARAIALPAELSGSPLARRPYDLRHACLSTWLNAGVPPAQVAEWAGHSVNVLLRVYAKCIDGQDEVAKQRIEAALRQTDDRLG